jgi:hypothetical protein
MLPKTPRQPLLTTPSGTPRGGRFNRLQPPPCSACGHHDTRVTLRTDYVLYFRCDHCGEISSSSETGG